MWSVHFYWISIIAHSWSPPCVALFLHALLAWKPPPHIFFIFNESNSSSSHMLLRVLMACILRGSSREANIYLSNFRYWVFALDIGSFFSIVNKHRWWGIIKGFFKNHNPHYHPLAMHQIMINIVVFASEIDATLSSISFWSINPYEIISSTLVPLICFCWTFFPTFDCWYCHYWFDDDVITSLNFFDFYMHLDCTCGRCLGLLQPSHCLFFYGLWMLF